MSLPIWIILVLSTHGEKNGNLCDQKWTLITKMIYNTIENLYNCSNLNVASIRCNITFGSFYYFVRDEHTGLAANFGRLYCIEYRTAQSGHTVTQGQIRHNSLSESVFNDATTCWESITVHFTFIVCIVIIKVWDNLNSRVWSLDFRKTVRWLLLLDKSVKFE